MRSLISPQTVYAKMLAGAVVLALFTALFWYIWSQMGLPLPSAAFGMSRYWDVIGVPLCAGLPLYWCIIRAWNPSQNAYVHRPIIAGMLEIFESFLAGVLCYMAHALAIVVIVVGITYGFIAGALTEYALIVTFIVVLLRTTMMNER